MEPMSDQSPSPWAGFSGLNDAYLLELYERYQADPASVDPQTRALFDQWGAPPEPVTGAAAPSLEPGAPETCFDPVLVASCGALATAIREYGYRAAQLDPLGSQP